MKSNNRRNIEQENTEMPIVSVIIAITDLELFENQINHLSQQTYKNIEFIIVNKQNNIEEKQFRPIVKKYLKKYKIKIIKFERTYGYLLNPVSDNELFLAGAAEAEGEYFIFTNDSVKYNKTYIADMVKKTREEHADFAYSDLAIKWKDGSVNRYVHKIDFNEKDSLSGTFIKNAGKLFGLCCTENKLISRKLWYKIYSDISTFYADENNNAAMYAGELVFSIALWSNAEKASYASKDFSIISWEEEDSKISAYCEECSENMTIEEIKSAVQFAETISTKNNVDKMDFETFVSHFLSRVIWRTDWIIPELKVNLETSLEINIPKFDLGRAFEKRTLELDLFEDEMNQSDLLESDSNLNIKIYISMHKPSFVPENNKYLVPIQVGTVLADERFPDMIHDDEGDNISEKNKMYCELTAQYWAWKNYHEADYYGFWHYRRYLSFNENEHGNEWGVIPYKALNSEALAKSNIDEQHIANICSCYDMVLPAEWKCIENGKKMTVYEHWCKHFNKNDMDIAVKIILKKYPQYYEAVMDVLQSDSAIFCNMFIMKKELFEEYSTFCFDVLEEVEEILDQKRYNVEEYRTLGHIAERLLAFYVRYVEITRPEIDICYLERTQYEDTCPVAKIVHPEKQNCVSVMLACDDKYMKYTDVLLESICENTSEDYFYDIVICHRGISEYNQRIAKDIFTSKSNVMLRFVDVTRNFENYGNVHIDRHLTYETYYRFLVLDIFEGYDRVLYLDCDMVVNSDISQLFFEEMNDEYIAAVRDYDFIAGCIKQKEFYQENILKYISIDDFFDYFQAGVILFNLKALKERFTSKKLFKVALSRKWYFHDQDVLNCLFNKHIKYLDDKWNVYSLLEKGSEREKLITQILPAQFAESYKDSIKEPCIIHYAGVPKVWNDEKVDLGYIFWKYARKSPYYEELVRILVTGEGIRTDWLVFTCDLQENKGLNFFTIKTIKENWSSDYAVIDFMFLSDHNVIETDTLTISASMFPHSQKEGWLDVKQFSWEKNVPVISDNVLFHVNSNNDIEIYVRLIGKYTGFSFNVRCLESRSIPKPVIAVNHHHFVDIVMDLPEGLRKGW